MIATAITKPLGLLYDCAVHKGDALGMVAAQALLQTWQWHKFIIAPLTLEQEDFSVPFDYAEQLREHGLFRLPFDEIVIQFGPADLMQILFDRERTELYAPSEFCVATVQHKDGVLEGRIFQTSPNRPIFSSFGRIILQLRIGPRDKELAVDEYATFVPVT